MSAPTSTNCDLTIADSASMLSAVCVIAQTRSQGLEVAGKLSQGATGRQAPVLEPPVADERQDRADRQQDNRYDQGGEARGQAQLNEQQHRGEQKDDHSEKARRDGAGEQPE